MKIELIEQQSNEDGTGFVDFEQDQILMPIVGSAQGDKKANGQPVAANYVDKIVTIENTGKSAAYVRAYFAIPSALDDGFAETFNAAANILHFNYGNKDGATTFGNQWNWMQANGKYKYFETTIDNVLYNVYFADYYQVLEAEAITEQFVSGVYLDKNVDMKDGEYIDKRYPDADLSILEGEVKCPVMAVAVQAEGFESAEAAITAAFGEQYNPFGGDVANWQ